VLGVRPSADGGKRKRSIGHSTSSTASLVSRTDGGTVDGGKRRLFRITRNVGLRSSRLSLWRLSPKATTSELKALVMGNMLSRLVLVLPIPNEKSTTTGPLDLMFGSPERLLRDNGPKFASDLIKLIMPLNLCDEYFLFLVASVDGWGYREVQSDPLPGPFQLRNPARTGLTISI
jgi:hypothetical protein